MSDIYSRLRPAQMFNVVSGKRGMKRNFAGVPMSYIWGYGVLHAWPS